MEVWHTVAYYEYTTRSGGLTLLVKFHVASLLITGISNNNGYQLRRKPVRTRRPFPLFCIRTEVVVSFLLYRFPLLLDEYTLSKVLTA